MSQSVIPPSGISIGGSVSLIVGRLVRNGLRRLNELDPIFHYMYDNRYFKDQKFAVIYLFYRYGIKIDLIPQYQRVHRKHKDLSIYIELDTLILDWADKNKRNILFL